jgi:hypothetical protein
MRITNNEDHTRIELDQDVLLYSSEIGGTVIFNGHKIPSESIWEILVGAAIGDQELDLTYLFNEARRAEIYRLTPMKRLVVTDTPSNIDIPVAGHEGVFIREEPNRVRPLFDHFGVLVGILTDPTEENLSKLFQAMMDLGYTPIDEINDKYYAVDSNRALEAVLAITGGVSPKPQQLAKFLKRPGASEYKVTFSSTGSYDEMNNDGTIAITSSIDRPVQGTFIGGSASDIILAKGIVRPPLSFTTRDKVLKEAEVHCAQAAFGKQMPLSGTMYALGATGKERCSINYQTLLFDFKDPGAIVKADTEALSVDAFDYMTKDAKKKMQAGVPGALLVDQISPWSILTSFKCDGIRAMVFGSYLVPIGSFALLPGSYRHLSNLLDEKDLRGLRFLVHRDPALPDSSTTYVAKCYGMAWFDTEAPGTTLGVIINPMDPAWKRAGGDFDGDSANILALNASTGGPYALLSPLTRESLRLEGRKYADMPPMERMRAALNEKTDKLLGPLVLAATKLTERGLCALATRSRVASAIQAAVEAKKHPVDHAAVESIAREVFADVRRLVTESGLDFYSTFQNKLKSANGVTEKVAAWDALVANSQLVLNNGIVHPSTAEYAMAKRVLKVDTLYRDIGFLRAQVRAEMPSALRIAAKAKCSEEAQLFIVKLSDEYRNAAQVVYAYADAALGDDSEGLLKELKSELAALRQKFRYYMKLGTETIPANDLQFAAIAYAPPRLAATFVDAEIYQELAHESREAIINLYGHSWDNCTTTIGALDPIPDHKGTVRSLGEPDTEVRITVLHRAKNSTRVYAQVLVGAGSSKP